MSVILVTLSAVLLALAAEPAQPMMGTWTVTGGLGTARAYHTSSLLPNGLVLVAAGVATSGHPSATVELYARFFFYGVRVRA